MQVEVKGDIETAIHYLRRLVAKDGIYALIRRREQSPNLRDRRKMKDLIAARRRVKREQRRGNGRGRD